MSKIIRVVDMSGYPKHGLMERISNLLSEREGYSAWLHDGHGFHQYYYNSEGWQLMYFTNYSMSEDMKWAMMEHIWELGDEHGIHPEHPQMENLLDEPIRFTIDGQEFEYLGTYWGYDHDSESPDDDLYEM